MNNVIINADDLGYSEAVNLAIIELFNKDFISSSTIMPNMKSFEHAVLLLRSNKKVEKCIGLHFNITEGIPLTKKILNFDIFCDKSGQFAYSRKSRFFFSKKEKYALIEEMEAQIQHCLEYGLRLSHADSHKHSLFDLSILKIALPILKKHGIFKIRNYYYQEHKFSSIKQFLKVQYYNEYNYLIKNAGFQTTAAFFRSPADLTDLTKLNTIELMVHPIFDNNGRIIDRIERIDYSNSLLGTVFPDRKFVSFSQI